MGLLSHDDILELHGAAVSAGCLDSRKTLLGGVDPGFAGRLQGAGNPSDQMLQDLHAMNAVGVLADGSVPLAIWLANAAGLTRSLHQAAVFRAALARIPRLPAIAPEQRPWHPEPASRAHEVDRRDDATTVLEILAAEGVMKRAELQRRSQLPDGRFEDAVRSLRARDHVRSTLESLTVTQAGRQRLHDAENRPARA